MAGTASNAVATGLSAVQLRVQLQAGSVYWNPVGGDFDQGNGELAWFNAVTASNPLWTSWTSSTTEISFTGADGSTFTVIARARNKAGTYSTTYASNTFVYDSLAPETGVLTPANLAFVNAFGTLTGTAADLPAAHPAAVTSMQVRIKRLSDNNFWNGGLGVAGAWNPATQTLTGTQGVSVSGAGWNMATANLPPAGPDVGRSYYITTSAGDSANGGGNVEAWGGVRGSTFTYDTTAPTTAISAPANAALLKTLGGLAGSGFDAVSISTVQLSVQDISITAPNCYAPASNNFTAACPNWFGAKTSTTNWTFNFAAQPWTQAHSYVIKSSATDLAANVQTAQTNASFTYDMLSPTATVTTTSDGYLNPLETELVGTSTDAPAGMSTLDIALSSSGVGSGWYNGSAFTGSAAQYFTTTTYTTAQPDAWTWDYPALTDGKNYTLRIRMNDLAANSRTQDFTFLYDETPAVASVTYPVDGAFLNVALTASGGSYDTAGAGGFASGASTIAVSIQSLNNGNCYAWGVGFTVACPNFIPATGGSAAAWTFAPSGNPLTPTHRYIVTTRATDLASNEQTAFGVGESSVTFTYVTAPPTVGVTAPVPQANDRETATTMAQLAGTASNAVATNLALVQLRVQLEAGGVYWDPTSHNFDQSNGELAWFNAVTASNPPWTSWTSTTTEISFVGTDGSTFTVVARATRRGRTRCRTRRTRSCATAGPRRP